MSGFPPASVYAGDTITFSASFSSYPATDWNLTYSFRGPSAVDATGSASGNDFVVTIPANKSKLMLEGLYKYIGFVTSGALRYTVDSGYVDVKPNLELDTSDRTAHAEKVLNAIEAAIAGRVDADLQSFTIGGRSVVHIPIKELLELRVVYKRELYILKNKGTPISSDIAVHFEGVS